MTKGKDEWGGRRATDMGKLVRATYGETCWLCGVWIRPGQFSVDHVLPKSTHPHLMWELGNMRPAHLRCNKKRGTKTPRATAPLPMPSRNW